MTSKYTISQYVPKHKEWPYKPSDFHRQDSSSDDSFYSAPRFVTHIDDAAIASLGEYYTTALPRKGRLLDFCSSWISHYPAPIQQAVESGELRVCGMGMNKSELSANSLLTGGRLLADLNEKPDIHALLSQHGFISSAEDDRLDAATNVVSIDYLTRPREVLSSLREATKTGGSVHLTVSNRCFPTKAVSRWLRSDEGERLEMVGDYLHFSGWKRIEIVELSDGRRKGDAAGGGGGIMSWVGMYTGRDPLWVVRAVKE